MARKVTAVGGFYSFISHGLGRELGMAMGFGSVVAYSVFEASLCGGFAYFMNLKILELTGANVGWPYLALFMVALIAILTYFDVKLSTWILGIALIGEVFILVVFDVGIFTNPAAHVDSRGDQPGERLQGLRRTRRPGGRCRGPRPVLRLLVVGRVRDGAELRRGIPRSQTDRAAVALHLRARSRHLLHDHQLGRGLRLSDRRRCDQGLADGFRAFLPDAGQHHGRRAGSAVS